jgi:hypothetical protein
MVDIESIKSELYKTLKLSNKQFVAECFEFMKKHHFSNEELAILTDLRKLNRSILSINRYTYPILKVVSPYGGTTEEDSHVNGYRRYYDDKHKYKGKLIFFAKNGITQIQL